MILNPDILLKLLTHNDDSAYQQLYQNYFVALKSFAMHYVGDEGAAEDVVQDVFIGMLKCEKTFVSLNDVKLYLYSSVKNRSISYLRNLKVQHKYIDETFHSAKDIDLFWDRVLEEDIYARLMTAVDSLPAQCRKVILLTLEGHTTAEIAELLNISVETVKDHKSNGKKKLAELLRNTCWVWILDVLIP